MLDINPLSVISFANGSPKSTECSKSISEGCLYQKSLHQETKISNKQSNLIPKETIERRTNKT